MEKSNNEAIDWINSNPNTYKRLLDNINEASDSLMGVPFIDSENKIINKNYEKELYCIIKEYSNDFSNIIYPLNSTETYIIRNRLSNDNGFSLKTRAIALKLDKNISEVEKIEKRIYKKLFVRLYFTYHLVNNVDSLVMAYYKEYIIKQELIDMPLKFILSTNSTFKVKDLINVESNKVYKYLGKTNFNIFSEFIHDLGITFPDENKSDVLSYVVDKIDKNISSRASDMEALVNIRNEFMDEEITFNRQLIKEYSNKKNSYFN